MKNNEMLVWPDCASSDVVIKVWANVNEVCKGLSLENYEDAEDYAYCNNCNTEHKSLKTEITDKESK